MAPGNRKAATNNAGKKKKKKSKSGPNSIAMKLKAPKPNPFESLWSRRKFDILGKKRKGEERRIGLARSLAIEKRKKTLLKEYEQSAKSSVFVDKRIGEQNEDLGEFDKAILRSQRERQLKLKKKSKYNLSDGEEDEFETQDGLSLGERDDFEDEIAFDEDEDDDDKVTGKDKRADILRQLNDHGTREQSAALLEGEENRPKSKKEVMEEIILKSRLFKAQKAKDKEENEQLIEKLDKEFSSMVHSEALLSLTQPNKMNALKSLVNKSIPTDILKKDEVADGLSQASSQQEKPDSYDKLVSEMLLDMRARPSDRTKTPEEIAQEEKERLEQLEEERQKRMVAADDSSDEDGDAFEDDHIGTKRVESVSGDDLGDSFSNEGEHRNKLRWIDLVLQKKQEEAQGEDADSSIDSENAEDDSEDEEEGSDTDDGGSRKSLSLRDWEQSDDDNFDTGLEDDNDVDEDEEEKEEDASDVGIKVDNKDHIEALETKGGQTESLNNKKMKASGTQHLDPDELPYTIEAPKSFEEFMSLVDNRSNDQIIEAVRRIRAFNAITVAVENRKKMQVFYGFLLQYFAVLANKKPLNFELLNLLVKPLMEMSTQIPYFAAICARQRLLWIRTQFCDDLKNIGKSCWPSLKTLFLLRLWSLIFPCSDFRHAVMTPAILLMCEYLMRCPIKSGRDIAIGSFLCSMVLSVSKQSQKFCPEAIIFIRTLLTTAFDKKKGLSQDFQLYHLMEIKSVGPLLCIQSSVVEIKSLDFLRLMDLPEDSPHFSSDSFRASVLLAIIETLQGFVSIYEGLNSFPEIFLPISRLLNELGDRNHMPDALKSKIREVAQLIDVKADEHHRLRKPLQMRKKKIVPIKLLNPKFEENFVKGRDYDPDRERAERRKLKKVLQQEAKGAQRELRKDNFFLHEVKQKDKALLEEERAEKYGKARAFLQEQEHAFKSGQLGKSRKRRR